MRVVLALACLCSCGGDDAGGGGSDGGADGGDAPAFDDCGDNEVSVAGGGCRRVGPPPECWAGWRATDDDGCEPILPSADCPAGTMPIIGMADCAPIGDCGDGKGTWGAIDVEPDALRVAADGSEAFSSIQQAIDSASPGDQIVVAAGEYDEDLYVGGRVRIEGRCAAMVTVSGSIWVAANDVSLRGVTVTGAGGIAVEKATDVTVAETAVVGAKSEGVVAWSAGVELLRVLVRDSGGGVYGYVSSLALRDVALVGNGLGGLVPDESDVTAERVVALDNESVGVYVAGSTASLDEVAVRGTLPDVEDAEGGFGIAIGRGCGGSAAAVEVRRAWLADNRSAGVLAYGSSVVLEDATVRDTELDEAFAACGDGVSIGSDPTAPGEGSLVVRRSLVAGNRARGVWVAGIPATLEDSVVRDTAPGGPGKPWAVGVYARDDPDSTAEDFVMRSCVVAGSGGYGVLVQGVTGTIEDSVVRDTGAKEAGAPINGYGISVLTDCNTDASAEATIRRTLVRDSVTVGVQVVGARAAIEDSAVRRTEREIATGEFGDGIAAMTWKGYDGPTAVDVLRTTVEDSARAGLYFRDAGGSLGASRVRRNAFAVALEGGADPAIADDNVFEDNDRDDTAVGQGLAPPPPAAAP